GALPETFLRDDPQARAEALLLPARHGEWGEYQRHGAQVVFQGTPGTYRGTGLAGECTDALLAEFGIDAAGARELRASGAVA
ncbi:MAG: hypothetical protein NTV19_00790, partial [Burkholderiales bacterium]|nr:hypothetical protein [Burkholderiales bacterium]